MKVTHIQYTARPPVKRSGDFIRLKVKAVLPSSIRESYTAAPHKKAGKKTQTTADLYQNRRWE